MFRAEQTFPALTPAALAALPSAPMSQIQNTPGALFNAMINPLIPYAIKGCLWYQGESNAGDSGHYQGLLTDLIADWRGRWGEGSFPFEIEQLANYNAPPAQPGDSGVAGIREAQRRVAEAVPDTGLAVAIDLGNPDGNIHPADKWDVGGRLSLVALANAYGKNIVHSGPIYAGMRSRTERSASSSGIRTAASSHGAGRCSGLPSPEPTKSSSGPTPKSTATPWSSPAHRCRSRSPCATPGRTTRGLQPLQRRRTARFAVPYRRLEVGHKNAGDRRTEIHSVSVRGIDESDKPKFGSRRRRNRWRPA